MAPRVAGSRGRRPATGVPGDGPAPAPAAPPAQAAAPVASQLLVCGRVGKPQGLRGEVTVEVRTDAPDERFADGSVLLTDPEDRGPLTVAATRDQNGRLVVHFAGVPDRTAAERLRGTLLLVDAATLPPPEDPEEFLDVQLVGLRAELEDGTAVGAVTEVLHLPHGDVLVLRRADPGARQPEVLVPFVAAMVPVVDVAGGRLVLAPPPGLLDLDGADAEADPPAELPADPPGELPGELHGDLPGDLHGDRPAGPP